MAENKKDECIQVVVRCRPMNKKENDEKRTNIINVDVESKQVNIRNPHIEEAPKTFTYDATYDEKTQQKLFYEESCFSIIESTLEGFNSTIFAYGQTGCGKSFTMQGPSTTDEEMRGVTPNAFAHIFQSVKSTKDVEFLIRCSYLELYNEEIKDLLCNPKSVVKCDIKEDPNKGVFIKGLTDVIVENEDDLSKMLEKGLINRTTASTNMNAESSRSHSIFTVVIEMSSKEADGREMLRVGKLNLVDLAGSERQKKTGASGEVLKEGIKINISLSCLGNVISALSEGNTRHIPYRDSKLTRLLQDSLGGNTKTMMIAAISPADYNYDETMSTLRYANRAKNIKNKPKINEDPKDAVIREYKDEIEKLRRMLLEKDALFANIGQAPMNSGAPQQFLAESKEDDRGGARGSGAAAAGALASSNPSSFHSSVSGGSQEFKSQPYNDRDDSSQQHQHEYGEDLFEAASPAKGGQHHHHVATGSGMDEQMQDRLRQKEHEVEMEKKKREELAYRLQQLEGMLVNNLEGESVKKINSPAKAPLSKEAAAEEEEKLKEYKLRKLKAKKKREAQQQAEMQRILEEKRAMEDELEELRLSAITVPGSGGGVGASTPLNNRGPSPVTASGGGGGAAAGGDVEALLKKMNKMKKRYEKRIQGISDELNDMQEDFYYQRKMLIEAVDEGEKDLRLYELICKSLLSEKDFKKVVDRCRYDDENDEWVIPFLKKKNVDHLDSGGYSALPKLNNSMLPDINNANSQGGYKPDMGSTMALPKFGNNGSLSARDGKGYKGTSSGGGGSGRDERERTSPSIVPLLTLPGGGTTASMLAMVSPPASAPHAQKHPKSDSYTMPPVTSSRQQNQQMQQQYEAEYNSGAESGRGGGGGGGGGIGYLDPAADKKKKNKNKMPKMPAPKGNESGGGGGGGSSAAPQNYHMPKIGGGGGGGSNSNGYNSSRGEVGGGAQYSAGEAQIDEAGTGETAGPLTDWGFGEYLNGGNGGEPEDGMVEYSDDEDFEADAKVSGPYPPSGGQAKGEGNHKHRHKKKKHKKHSSYNNSEEDQPQQHSSPRAQLTLPKI